MTLLTIAMLAPWVAGVSCLVLDSRRRVTGWIAVIAMAITLVSLVGLTFEVSTNGPVTMTTGDWPGGVLPQPHGAQEGGHAVWAWGVRTAPADLAIPTGYRGGTVRVARGERLLRTRWAWGPTAGNGHGNVDIPESLFRAVGHDLWATVDR